MIWLTFANPMWLILIPSLIWSTWRVSASSYAGLSKGRAASSLLLRSLILVLFVMALAEPQAVRRVRELCVMYLLDVSKSVSAADVKFATEWIRQSQKTMRSGDTAGLILFGSSALLDTAPSTAMLPLNPHAKPDGSATDIAAALRVAMASFPQNASRHIVLLTDGNETAGNALDQAAVARASGVRVDSRPLGSASPGEAWLESLTVPQKLKVGEPFEARIVIGSTHAQHGVIRLYKNGTPAASTRLTLNSGRSVILLPQKAGGGGSQHWQAVLDPEKDSSPENNRALAFARVEGRPKLLLVTSDRAADRAVTEALRTARMNLHVISPAEVPATSSGFLDVDAIVLSNVPATSLSPRQMLAIRQSVQQLGVGLAMIGGASSFGAGGYFKTPVEEALPVKMTLRKQRFIPSMAVLIVIDKSGSMGAPESGVEKIRLANEAAIACIDVIQPEDQIAVIACDSEPKLVAPMRRAKEKASIVQDIRSIRAGGGGIMVHSSLTRARNIMQGVDARIRHIILLADGSDAEEQKDSVSLVREMAAHRITVSTVAIGRGPDEGFLGQVAQAGGGNFYVTESAHSLPAIFTKETLLASRSLLVEESFHPVVRPDAEPVKGLRLNAMPPLLGYVATTPKPLATQAMVSHKSDPILATWQFGLGRALAFTSDSGPRWSALWTEHSFFPALWAQSMRWISRRTAPASWQSSIDLKGGTGTVIADAVNPRGAPIDDLSLTARVIMPDGNARQVQLSQTATGRYEGTFPADQTGDYVVNLTDATNPEASQDSVAASRAYPDEYASFGQNVELLRSISSQSGGTFDPIPADVFRRTPRSERRSSDVWHVFAMAAFLLLPLDVAMRRLVITKEEATAAAKGLVELLPKRKPLVAETPPIPSRLLQEKRQRRDQAAEPPVDVEMASISTTDSSSQ